MPAQNNGAGILFFRMMWLRRFIPSARTKGFEGCYSHYFAGGFGSVVPSFQLYPVFGIDTERVPPNDAMSRLVGFGGKSWDNFKNFFQTQGFEFLFLSQRSFRP